MKRNYATPKILTEESFETSALSCAKTAEPPLGSWHTSSAYDTFIGHFGSGFAGAIESSSGSAGVGFGPGGTSASYYYSGLCGNWVTFSS